MDPTRPKAAAPGTRTADLRTATRATVVVFATSGFAFASWVTRVPAVRDGLHLDPGRLGLVLLALSIGSVLSLPAAGAVVERFGPARTVRATGLLVAAGLAAVAGVHATTPFAVAGALFVTSCGIGLWDVAMNVHGARVEQELGRSLMPRLHAAWSLGTVAGALLGTALVAAGLPTAAHLGGVAAVVAVLVVVATYRFLPEGAGAAAPAPVARAPGVLRAWAEPRTLLIGLFVLGMAFTEGVANDWLAVATIDGYSVPAGQGTAAFAVFVAAMTAGRMAGPPLLDRWGRVPVLRVSALAALAGVLLVALGRGYPLALIGALAWGLGTALGFPVGMSAAADEPVRAAARVSVASTIGYTAFLAGPPLIGLLGDDLGTQRALLATAVALVLALALAGALRPPGGRVR